ncbi:hypothetical protein [Solirhodobacter olei]|uniref:hypothetical protein n=1 Tax=Solirhodobacter olei TaxID=2493082 RepID=UPI000FDAAB16|nr:hypothetical protein [Solirhodobacter olei]
MTYQSLYRRLHDDPSFSNQAGLAGPLSGVAALELLTRFVGIPLAALDVPPIELSRQFPRNEVPEVARGVFGRELTRYRKWRNLLLDCLLVHTGSPVDADTIDALRRIWRLEFGSAQANRLTEISNLLPSPLGLKDLTRTSAIEIDAKLSGNKRQTFRAGLSVLDRLRDLKIVTDAGLLPTEKIGYLAKPSAHATAVPLPPQLEEYRAAAPERVKYGLPFVWRLAVTAGILRPAADVTPAMLVEPEILMRLRALRPADFGFRRPGVEAYRVYLKAIADDLVPGLLERLSHERDPAATAWSELRRRLREAGQHRAEQRLATVGACAARAKLKPEQLTSDWFADQQRQLRGSSVDGFLRGARMLDQLRGSGLLDPALLPAGPSGVPPALPRANKPKTAKPKKVGRNPCPTLTEVWTYFFEDLRKTGLEKSRVHRFYALKAVALRAGCRPNELDATLVDNARRMTNSQKANAISGAARLLDELRSVEDLRSYMPARPIGPLPDRRQSAPDLTGELAEETECALRLRGLSASGSRSTRIAVKAFAAVARGRDMGFASLSELLTYDFEQIDWGLVQAKVNRYKSSLRALRDFLFLAWTPDWTALQEAVVRAGVSSVDNPVSALLGYAQGRSPAELDLAWAVGVDRDLRRCSTHAPYGRADLALTFARNIARLDALHGIETVRATDLLPSLIGPIRM